MGQVVPIRGGQRAGPEGVAVYPRLGGEDAVGELLLAHFQAENRHRHPLLFRHIGGDVQRKAGFAHAGAGGQDHQVRAAKAGQDGVQVGEPGGDAAVLVLVGAADLLQAHQRFHNGGGKAG